MKKGFILVDIPETCLDCRFCREIDEGIEACCELELNPTDNELIREIDVSYTQEKPDWCPIRNFPENDTKNYHSDEYLSRYADGWNTCISCLMNI